MRRVMDQRGGGDRRSDAKKEQEKRDKTSTIVAQLMGKRGAFRKKKISTREWNERQGGKALGAGPARSIRLDLREKLRAACVSGPAQCTTEAGKGRGAVAGKKMSEPNKGNRGKRKRDGRSGLITLGRDSGSHGV